jgi:hypothetical protein
MRRGCPIAVVVAAALLCAPAPAMAGAAPFATAPALYAHVAELSQVAELLGRGPSPLDRRRAPSFSVLRFENRDGYVITVLASRQTVALRVARRYSGDQRPRRALSTTYLAHGRATPTSIEASFGDRGRISLRFKPAGRGLRANRKAGCRRAGGFPIARFGYFVGVLRFRGEDGYISATVHRVRGGAFSLAALLACLLGKGSAGRSVVPPSAHLPFDLRPFGVGSRRYGGPPGAPGVDTHPGRRPRRTALVSDLKLPISRTVFAALGRESARARFLAFEAGSEGSVAIARIALASAPPSAFTSNDSLSRAMVSPPPPFSGTAAFDHGPGREKSWTGTLAVSFLGKPRVPLAGEPFQALLARNW